MKIKTRLELENRINKLAAKDPVANAKIIKKLERELRRIG